MSKETKIIPLSESDEFREVARVRYFDAMPEITFEHKQHPTLRAQFAMELMKAGGAMIAARNDGEDSSGRAQMRPETPAELVDRAVTVADLAFNAFNERGWMHTTTSMAEAMDICDVAKELEKADA